jgi:uncharacterized spore protein YtfJ
MSLNRVFDLIEETRETANWKAAFGEPQQAEGQTIIPVAQVSYGFGLGFGQGAPPAQAESASEPAAQGEGGGGGGGASSKPLGVIVITPERVRFEPVQDEAKIALAGMAVGALFLWQLGAILRALFSRE